MKYCFLAILIAACLAPAMADVTVAGEIYTGSYTVNVDSMKFATPGGITTFVAPGWGGGTEVRDTASFRLPAVPTMFGMYYRVGNDTMEPFYFRFVQDSLYYIPFLGQPRPHMPRLKWLTVGIEEENRMGIEAGISAVPNPFSTRTAIHLAAGVAQQVAVFDRSGALVRALDARQSGGHGQTFAWDGRDAHGRRLAAGAYFAVPIGAARRNPTKLILTD